MKLQQLRYVKALVDKGSFVAAANSCAVTQPTLSNGLAQLEAELGDRLFRRTTRTMKLTPYGQRLLPTIVEIIARFDQLKVLSKSEVRSKSETGGPAVALQVGISPLVGIKRARKLLSRFKSKHPTVEVVFRESSLDDLCEKLDSGVVDVVLAPYDASLHLAADRVCGLSDHDPLVFLPKSYDHARWLGADSVALGEIAGETFVLNPDNCGLTRFTARMFGTNNLALKRYAGEASSYAAIQEFADSGLACGILPASKLRDGSSPAIPIVHLEQPVALEYFVLGKASSIAPELLAQFWDDLPHGQGLATAEVRAKQPCQLRPA